MADNKKSTGPGGPLIDPSKYPVPIETIYVNRILERIPIPLLKEYMTVMFESYGPILDIIAKRSLKRKGQAFIVFDAEKSCLDAVSEMDGFILCGKAIGVAKARTHSDVTVKRKVSDLFDEHKSKRLMLKDLKRAEEDAKVAANPAAIEKSRAPRPGGVTLVPDEYVRPNKTLFLQNLPANCEEADLNTIFEQFDGFREVRFIKVRGLAFAEFENEQFAIKAKEASANAAVGADGKPMKVSYQRQ